MEYEKIVNEAGGKFKGVVEGLVWFDAPSRSTLVIPVSEFSAERVREKLAIDAAKDWGPGLHYHGPAQSHQRQE